MVVRTKDSEPYGTTPLPTSFDGKPASVWFDGKSVEDIAQQPQTQQIAVFEATPNEECINGSLLDVNQHFVVYAVKNGLIRILHRHSALRSLLRGHAGQQVTDIRFFLDGDVLGTVGGTNTLQQDGSTGVSSVIIWRVFEQSPEIMSEKLLEIPTHAFTMSRLVWHPFNPNQFWMMHTNATEHMVATLVETTRIQTMTHATESHAVCQFHDDFMIMDGAVQLSSSTPSTTDLGGGSVTDLCWSGRDTRHVLTVHDNGCILLWDLKQLDSSTNQTWTTPKVLHQIQQDQPISRCFFLPHENTVGKADMGTGTTSLTTCFATASQQNSVITLWSSFSQDPNVPPTKLQVLGVDNPSTSYVIDLCFGPAPQDASPPSCFILMADRHVGKLFAFHVQSEWNVSAQLEQKKALAIGCDYVVPFVHKHPIYSWCVVCSPTTDISEEELQEQAGLIFDMKLFAYQSKVVQCLTLTSYMCLPPEHTWSDPTLGVRVESLGQEGGTVSDAIRAIPDAQPAAAETLKDAEYDEDYDVEDEEDEEVEPPEPSSLPSPDDLPSSPTNDSAASDGVPGLGVDNAFANWLGAIAVKSSGGTSGPPGIPPPAPPSTPAAGFLASGKLPEQAPGMAPPPGLPALSEALLSPLDILAGGGSSTNNSSPTPTSPPPIGSSSNKANNNSANNKKGRTNKSPKRKGRSKSPKKDKSKLPFPDGKFSILKREDKPTPTPSASTPTSQPVGSLPPVAASQPSADAVTPLTKTETMASAPSTAPVTTEQFEAAVGKVLLEQFEKQESVVSSLVQGTIQKEFDAKMLPALREVVQQSLESSVVRPLESSMDQLGKNGVQVNKEDLADAVATSVEAPLKAIMADTMRKVFIPAFESLSSQVVDQISKQMPSPPPPPADTTTPKLEELATQIASMSASMERMFSEMEQLKNTVATQAEAAAAAAAAGAIKQQQQQQQQNAPAFSHFDKLEAIRNEINALLHQRNYEAAFTKALSASTADMAVYCCSRADVSQVLGGSSPALSQPILLCLMQQLGAGLASTKSDLRVELEWLQEIALTLNPADPHIVRHVPSVLQQLVASINNKMAEGNPQLRRPLHMLLQVIRGMQVG